MSTRLLMRDDLVKIIRELTDEKKSKHIVPSAALYSEISAALHREAQEELNAMVKDGILEWSRTLNSIAFKIKKNNGNSNN